jgi:hypothetical protein
VTSYCSFFSAASPLDETDLPLLTELTRQLPFIPVKFVVTRADEFRKDSDQRISNENLDTARYTRFLGEVLIRIKKLFPSSRHTEESFILVDNRQSYNVEALANLLKAKCDPTNPQARIVMHANKLEFFRASAKELRKFFEEFLDGKLKGLTRIVDTAEQNINRYNENVLISNNNLTKHWLDQLTNIANERERALNGISGIIQLPSSVESFDHAFKRRRQTNQELLSACQFIARDISEPWATAFAKRLQAHVRDTLLPHYESQLEDETNFESLPSFMNLKMSMDSSKLFFPSALSSYWVSNREAKAFALREAAGSIRKSLEELELQVQGGVPWVVYESFVKTSQASLAADLNRFLGNAELYRAGVFSHTTKDAITALGLGKQLDDLEEEFSEGERASFLADASNSVFPGFGDIGQGIKLRMSKIEKDLIPLASRLKDIKVNSPDGAQESVTTHLDAEKSILTREITDELEDDLRRLAQKLDGGIAALMVERRRKLKVDINAARSGRRSKYVFAALLGFAISIAFYSGYRWLGGDLPQSIFANFMINIGSGVALSLVSLAVTKWLDNFPRRAARIRRDYRAVLRKDIGELAERELAAHDFVSMNSERLASKLYQVCQSTLDLDPENWNTEANARLESLRACTDELVGILNEYDDVVVKASDDVSAYFNDHSKNLAVLNEVALKIKERAIQPSFELLENTRTSLNSIKTQVQAVPL